MSDWTLGKKLNSQIADVPLNHLIWLQDYKTYGEDSYVFQDKDIYNELMRSAPAINDINTFSEALTHISEDGVNFGSFFKNFYPIKANREQIAQLASTSGLFSESVIGVLDDVVNSVYSSAFFDNEGVIKSLSNVDICKSIFANASISVLTAIEASGCIKKYTDLIETITSISGNPAYGQNPISVENAFVTTIEVGSAYWSGWDKRPSSSLIWMDDNVVTVYDGYADASGTTGILTSPEIINVYRFVKSLTIGTVDNSSYTSVGSQSRINYVPMTE